jgi:hypothetical protein
MTLDELTDVYQTWAAECGYEPMSADELLTELLVAEPVNVIDVQWLKRFLKQWKRAEDDSVADYGDPENVYNLSSIRQSIEEDRK